MRRLLLSLLALAAFAATASAQSFSSQDTVAYATATIRVREQPAVTAETVAILGQGTQVRLYHCSEGWCGVSVAIPYRSCAKTPSAQSMTASIFT